MSSVISGTIETIDKILNEISILSEKLSNDQLEKMKELIFSSKRVFIGGAGRSFLIAKAFAVRLMQLGFVVHIAGEVTTPAIRKDDLFIVPSGSGETSGVVQNARIAKKEESIVLAITTNPSSSLGSIADYIVQIPTTTNKISREDNPDELQVSNQPGGNAFEQMLYILFDAVAMCLVNENNNLNEDVMILHANLE